MSAETGELICRTYKNFRGCDFRGEEINLSRSPDSLNMWRNYKKTSSIETRPGMECVFACGATVYGIYFFNGKMIVHSGTQLLSVSGSTSSVLYSGVNAANSNAFIYDNVWYFLDGKNYLQYDGYMCQAVVGYAPTTSIGRKPEGGGTIYEDVNLISGYRKNTFLADGTSKTFYLDAQNIDTDYKPTVMVNDKTQGTSSYTVDYTKGAITFTTAPAGPNTDGQDNVSVLFRKSNSANENKIRNCTLLQVFDNRVFFSGNPNYPNTVWHCSLDDPTYCSDLDYYREGMDSAQIKGMVAGNNALWVFREPSESATNVFYHTPTIDDEYGKIYPSTHSSVTIGCVGKAINFNDDIVFFSERGMEGISGDVTTEQFAAHRSTLVDSKLISDAEYKNMLLAEWEGYLLIFVGNKVFLADSQGILTNENHTEYEFFYWELSERVTACTTRDGVLYLGTDKGVYTLTDTECDIESYWVTPKDKFQAPQKLKTTNKRGCVVEATGDVTLYAKLEDTDFEPIGTYENVTDYFVSRIKKKKWKDIQLKFYSPTRFSIETVTLEAFVGGYIKR